jgi:hypothetical protein
VKSKTKRQLEKLKKRVRVLESAARRQDDHLVDLDVRVDELEGDFASDPIAEH